MNRRARQQDIAKELGLSINTVSLALKDSSRINEDTRIKVQEVAKALNYIPNSIARSLVQKKTNIIGFILPKITNPIQIETAQRIERKLLPHGYNMILMTSDHDKNHESNALDILLSRQVDGIFLFPTDIQNVSSSISPGAVDTNIWSHKTRFVPPQERATMLRAGQSRLLSHRQFG